MKFLTKRLITLTAFCLGSLLPSVARAELVYSQAVTIKQIVTQMEYGGGDVVFVMNATTAGCDGFWLRATDPGFKSGYAALLTNYVTERSLIVGAHDHSLWAGSSTKKYCRVHDLRTS